MTRYAMTNGTQTRKYASGQPFAEDYQVWLAGYWEDFTSSYSLPEATTNSLSTTNSHFGNPLNAEARLNPHYRWSYADRTSTYSGATVYGGGKVTNDIKELHNLSMAEWLTIDVTRLDKGRAFSSKINNEFLDSHTHSNRYKLGGKGELDNHILMSPSYMSSGKYYINNGDTDSSFTRTDTNAGYRFHQNAGISSANSQTYDTNRAGTTVSSFVDYSVVFNDSGQDATIFHTASAVTTGSFTIDTSPSNILTADWDHNQHDAHILGAEIKSPSRTPFLAIRHTMPATHRINGDVDPAGPDGVWRYTGNKRELHHLRVGDIVQIGKHDEFGVIQEINLTQNKITKLYSLSRNQLLDVSKFKSTNGEYIGGGASEGNVDIRKWFEPVINYDGSLNCVGDGDTFHLRFCPLNIKDNGLPDSDRISHYVIRVGYDSTRLNMGSRGNRYELSGSDYNPSHSISAIQFELQPHPTSESQKIEYNANLVRVSALDSNISTVHKQSFIDVDSTSTVTTPNYTNEWQQWLDVDVVMDFTNQRYKVYVDGYEGGTFNFETKPSGGNWSASDLYGYHIDHASLQKDGTFTPDNGTNEFGLTAGKWWGPKSERTGTMWTLIDRVGIVNEITNPVRNSPNTVKAGSDMGVSLIDYKSGINKSSSMKISVIDDDNERQVQDIFQSAPSEWMMLLFKHGIDSPQWLGFLEQVQIKQNAKKNTREINILARDAIGRLDSIMPYWEVGQNEKTISTDYTYREEEALMVSDNFYFGARALLRGSKSIGMDHQTRALDPQASTTEIGAISGYYSARYDQRTRLFSANPIQMYVGQDTFGPSAEPDVYNTSPTALDSDKNIWRMWNSRKIIGFSDGRTHGNKYIIAHCIEHGLSVNDEFKIYDEYGGNAFTTDNNGKNGIDILVKKVIDNHHFCFEYKTGVGDIFGHLQDEPGHFYSVVTRHPDKNGLGFSFGSSSPYAYTGWTQGNFVETSARGLIPIKQHQSVGMGRINPTDGRQFSAYYTREDYYNLDHGVGPLLPATAVTWDYVSDATSPDSIVHNTWGRDFSTAFDNHTTESTNDWRGYSQYGLKPAGIIPLENATIKYITDPHGLVTVGPMFNFYDGRQLPSADDQYNYRFALEYIGTIGSTHRSQIMSIVDYCHKFKKTYYRYSSVTGSNWEGNDDTNLTMVVRGNDIDQQNPSQLPLVSVNEQWSNSIPHMGSNVTAFMRPNEVDMKITAQSGSGNSVILTVTAGMVDLLPSSGWGTIGPNGTSQHFFRWRGIDVANDQLTGCTILQAGAQTITQLMNLNIATLSTFLFPVISNCQALFTPPTTRQPKEQYRVAHASYMHDIASSMWFRMVFGIIEPNASGVNGPGKDVLARHGNRRTLIHSSGTSTNVGWRFQNFTDNNIDPYTTQYSEYFTLKAPYVAGTSTTLTLDKATVPLIDENFKDRRFIDRGLATYDTGTDPTISIPSRANAHSSKRFMNNGGLVFEIENDDGTIDVGVGRSAKITNCLDKSDDDYTHWEIVKITQTEIENVLNPLTNQWELKGESANSIFPGPITLTAAHVASSYVTTNKTKWDTNRLKDPDYFHSGSASAVSGSRMFQSISVGDIVFLGNSQGSKTQPVTTSIDAHYNVDNIYGEDRDFVSYRWYRVLDKADDHSTITIFPAEYAYCNHTITSNRHPVAMGETTSNASGSFQGWKFKLVKGTGSPVDNPGLSGGATQNGPTISKLYAGDVEISGVKFLKNSHSIGAKGRFRKIKNNFNHIWLNWADMRNDGSADADGGARKTNFGLLYPTEEQYKVSVVFADTQEDIAELAIGTDIDMWELGSTDPFTSAVWSGNYSDKMTTLTHLQNWGDKAGAPMAIDASKFFNLNTMTNNGRIGQSSGGVKTIGEYDLSEAGKAKLMDNYWWQAGPHPYTAKYRYPYDPNYQFYVRYESKIMENLDNKPVMVLDSSKFYEGSYFPDIKGAGTMEFKQDENTIDTFTYRMGGCFVSHYDEKANSDAVRLYTHLGTNKVDFSNKDVQDPIGVSMASTSLSKQISDNASSVEHNVWGSWSTQMSLSALLVMEGYVKSPMCGTYYEHDKIRLLFQTHGVKSWLSGSGIPSNYDINNVPIAYDMATDSFGSVLDSRGSTTLQSISSIQKISGQGDGGNYNAFNYMIGRNGRFEFRPSYNSNEAITRNILAESEVKTQARTQFTHVRVHYNTGESFLDYPTPILDGSQIKFKIVNAPNTRTGAEAKAIAIRALETVKDKKVKVSARIIGDSTNRNAMFDGGLYGYISTPLVQCLSDLGSAANYGAFDPHGNMTGQIIGGRQNAMDGNLISTNSNLIGAQRSMEYLESGSGFHGGGGCDTYDTHATQWYGQYTPYGIHSIEKAVQIVHIPRGTPKVSAGSGQKLRMFITHKGTSANEANFRLWLVDSHFDSNRRQGYTGNNPLTSSKISYLDITKNGFHEVPFPTSYGASSGAKMIVSFNKEYCVDLLKYRSNHTTASKTNKGNRTTTLPSTDVSVLDLSMGNPVNEASAFPLGLSLYNRPHGAEDSEGRQGPLWQLRPRALYYAPTVEIVDDMVWKVGTVVSYNDSHLNLNTDLTVVDVHWSQKEQETEVVDLELLKDESQYRPIPSIFGGGAKPMDPPASGNPPNNGGGGLPGGGIGDIPYLPGDDIGGAPGWGGLKPPEKGGIGAGHTLLEKTSRQNRLSDISGAPNQQGGNGLGSTMTGGKVSLSKMSKGTMGALKGKADLSSENEGGGLLGINRNRSSIKNQIKTTSKEAIGQSKTTSSGSAIIGADGFILPGVSAQLESGVPIQSDYHEGSVSITVPPSIVNEMIKVTATVSAPLTGGGTIYTLFATLECIETGHRQSKVIDINYNDTAQRITLFSIRKVEGASVLGNRIKVTIGRVPGGGLMTSGDGSDTAPFSSLTVKGIEVSFNENARNKELGKGSTTNKLTSKDRTDGWMSKTDNTWKSKTSDATFDSSGNVSYDRRGKAGSNAIKKDEEDSLT